MLGSDQPIRVIHHLSATGGTIISRCIAAMPKVVLLSELHPVTPSMAFYPLDPLGQIAWNYAELLPPESTMFSLFRERLKPVVDLCLADNRFLVLRDHSHSDYLSKRSPAPRLIEALKSQYQLRQVVTVRNPIDSWLSMVKSGFAADIGSFEEYCERYLRFLADYDAVPMWRYEDFVANPEQVVWSICQELDIPFGPDFEARAASITLTGDSGRRPARVQALPRRDVPDGFVASALKISAFREIAQKFTYETDV